MDTTMFQLRLFVHQRLYSAAEEIFGEVEKAITLALKEPEVSRSKEEVETLRLQRQKLAPDPSLRSSTVEHGAECDAPQLQENPEPSTPGEPNLSLCPDVPGPSQTSTDVDNNNWNYCLVQTDFRMCKIKEEQEQIEDDSQTQEMVFLSPEIVKSEQNQSEIQVLNELQPISSDNFPAQSENDDHDEHLVKNKVKQTKRMKRKTKQYQGQSVTVNKKDQAALPHNKQSAKSEKEQNFCPFCGKRFHYIRSLMKHIKTHEERFDCTICRMKCQSVKQLIAHLKSWHNKTCVCRFCGRIFSKVGFLRAHEKTHEAQEQSLSSSTVEHGGDAPQLQENPDPSAPEEPNVSLSAEIPGSSQTSTDLDSNNPNCCLVQTDLKMTEVKGGQEQLWDDSQTQEMDFPSPKIVECEQDQPETQAYELQPLNSDCSAAESKHYDSDVELVNNKGDQTIKQKGQSVSDNEKDQSALPHDTSSKSDKVRSFCHFCGKGFQYIGFLMNHIKSHEQENDCSICGKKCRSPKEVMVHVQSEHKNAPICNVCDKYFDNLRSLRVHQRVHTNKNEFSCQECGKTFHRRAHLTVHERTHTGEKPYECDICGRAFSQSQNLTIHKRSHSAAEPSLSSSEVEHGDKCDVPPSAQEELNFCLSAEVLGSYQSSADLDNNNCQMLEIKGEREELGNDSQTQEMVFSSPEVVKIEQPQPEIQVSYELQPLSSDCPVAQSENDSDEELMKNKGEQTKTMRRKGSVSVNEKDPAVLPCDKSSAKSEKDCSFCHICGKGFQYIGSLMKHIKSHERKPDCTVCGKTYHSTKQLITHVKSCHNEACFCDVCGKTFANVHCLRVHDKVHKGIKEFACQECGKTFSQKGHLIVHVRTHSGEKPYECDTCGKAFSQSQSLTIHKRIHSGEKPYGCDLCDKQFVTRSHLKVHMRFHTREKPYPCDICGKRFSHRSMMSMHRTTHTRYDWSEHPTEN